jgi:hypothetical protein
MIARAEQNTQITPDRLEARDATPRRSPKDAAAELEALLARISAARTLMPEAHAVHCRDCFQKGRDAVLRVIEGE